MKRTTAFLLLFLLCRQPMMAQNPSEAEVWAWYNEGKQTMMEQQYSYALSCLEKARDGFHKLGQTENEINALDNIGTCKRFRYDSKGAMAAYQQAGGLASAIRHYRKLMTLLINQKRLSEQLGEEELSDAITARIDSLFTGTKDDGVKFEYYRYMGAEAKGQKNYILAERWYRKNDPYVNQLNKEYNGADKFNHYTELENLYQAAGNVDGALKYAILGKNEFLRLFGERGREIYIDYMRSIAELYAQKGDSTQCSRTIDTLFVMSGRLDEPREKHDLYITRGTCHKKFKNYGLALADYRKADEVLAAQYGEDDSDRIELKALMGGMEHKLGHHEEAEHLYRKYAEGIRNLQGENNLDYIDALGYQANAEAFAGHLEAACNDYIIAVSKLKEQIQRKLPYLSTAERESYWRQTSQLIQDMTPFALEAKEYQTAFTSSCYDGLVLSKAFLLETERSLYDIIKTGGTADDLHDFTQIAAMQSRIREWEKAGDVYADSILELTSKTRQLETRLAGKCRSYGDMTSFMGIGYKEIKERLDDGEVLLDFTDFVSESRGRMYAAYIIEGKQEFPLLKNLFAERTIDSMQVKRPDLYYKKPYAKTMYQLLWMPFKEYVAEGSTVYYVPSQLLFQIALESLPTEDGTLLGEHYHFVRLSSARELVRFKERPDIDMASAGINAVLYGGLKYDLEANDMAAEAKKYDVSPLLAFRGGMLRGDSIFRELPGSKKEVDAIEQILKEHKLKVTSYTDKLGTEESFLNMNGKAPQILHISTHGFFYTPDEAQKIDYLRGYEDAMSLSGLVMSGGNAAWRGKEPPEGVLSGILTASSVARLDLTGTKLAVLSACHSGKGEATSEGLYGLQRAFKKAGAGTIIMSLWKVSDVVGTEFMNLFYENLFDKNNHYDKRAAFDKAKSAIRQKYPEPFYWACFVMLD